MKVPLVDVVFQIIRHAPFLRQTEFPSKRRESFVAEAAVMAAIPVKLAEWIKILSAERLALSLSAEHRFVFFTCSASKKNLLWIAEFLADCIKLYLQDTHLSLDPCKNLFGNSNLKHFISN